MPLKSAVYNPARFIAALAPSGKLNLAHPEQLTVAAGDSPMPQGSHRCTSSMEPTASAPKLVAYRNDWCIHCDNAVLAKQWRYFLVEHFFWILLIPTGFHKEWRCERCGKDPRNRQLGPVHALVIAMIVSAVGFAVFLSQAPYSGDIAPLFWTMLAGFGGLTVGFALWLKFEVRSPPMRKEVEPLRNDRCLFCGGRMTDYPQWHCVECGVIRYNDERVLSRLSHPGPPARPH